MGAVKTGGNYSAPPNSYPLHKRFVVQPDLDYNPYSSGK